MVLISIRIFITHGFGQGAVIWVFISEIFPNKVRAREQSLGSFTHWFMAAIVSWTFRFCRIFGRHVFTFYDFMILQLLWVEIKMPETREYLLNNWRKSGIDIKFNLNYEKNKFFNMCFANIWFGSCSGG